MLYHFNFGHTVIKSWITIFSNLVTVAYQGPYPTLSIKNIQSSFWPLNTWYISIQFKTEMLLSGPGYITVAEFFILVVPTMFLAIVSLPLQVARFEPSIVGLMSRIFYHWATGAQPDVTNLKLTKLPNIFFIIVSPMLNVMLKAYSITINMLVKNELANC